MKRTSIILMTSILLLIIILTIFIPKTNISLFHGLNLIIIILVIVIGLIALYLSIKKDKEIKAGFPSEDEMSLLLKYKTGYYAYLYSMYMWLFIFIFKDKFPNVETMLGGGILLSTFIYFITKVIIKKKTDEK